MRSGMGIEIAPIYTRTPGIPVTEWAPLKRPRWLFRISVITKELAYPTILLVGNIPFASDDEAAMPPTYREPDNIEPRYTIEERGMYRYTSDPADLNGIAKDEWLLPSTLGRFLKQKYDEGELEEVEVKPSDI